MAPRPYYHHKIDQNVGKVPSYLQDAEVPFLTSLEYVLIHRRPTEQLIPDGAHY